MSYNGCNISNYSRINPNTGAGFILSRLATRNMTKREVYEGTHYKYWKPGYHSSIWAKLLEDKLIAPWDGFMDVSNSASPYAFCPWKAKTHIRAKGRIEANGKYTVRYFITDLGKQTLAKMNERLAKIIEDKKEFCKRNGIQFGTGKTLPTVKEFDEKIGPVSLLAVSDGKAALDKLDHFDPDLAAKLDSVIRELQEIRASL